jgi:Secretion system C-terminal sorting domain
MRIKNLYFIKSIYVLCILMLLHFGGYAQKFLPLHLRDVLKPLNQPPQSILQNCNLPNNTTCNYNTNYTFTPSASYNPLIFEHYIDPFNYDGINTLIPNWEVATGSPTVWANNGFFTNYPQPPNGSNYYFGYVGWHSTSAAFASESVLQKIPLLSTNKTYTLSFQKMYKSWLELAPPYNTDFPVSSFRIILMKCNDYASTFLPLTYAAKIPPANSQTIYCEIDVHNSNWQEVFFKFTPNDNYNLMWIFPETENSFPVKQSGLLATMPELIDVTNFTAGPTPTPTTGNCVVTIGPTTPNCVPTTAVLKWYGPNNQIITAPATQKIQVNASIPANQGTWTLKLEMPNAVTTNSQCGIQNPVIQASVNVPYCVSTAPTITGYIDGFSACPGPIINLFTNITNYYCWGGDCSKAVVLESSQAINNQWFINNIEIPSAGGQVIGVGYVVLLNNSQKLIYYPNSNEANTQLFTFKVRNCINNSCTPFSQEMLVFSGVVPGSTGSYPSSFMGYYKPNQSRTYYNQPFRSAGPGSQYFWNVPNTTITDINNSTPEAIIYFPPTTPINAQIEGTITITNSPTCNGVYNIHFLYDFNFAPSDSHIQKISTLIYPNPTTTQVTISTTNNSLIQSVEIGNLFNPIIKRVVGNNNVTTTINVAALVPGIYNCKITTNKGIEYQKLIIKR